MGGLFIIKYNKVSLDKILNVFVISALFQAVIGIFQFALNSSLGLNILGETLLSTDLKNIAKITFGDNQHIRAYGLFRHPNIMAMFLSVSTLFLLQLKKKFKGNTILMYLLLFILILATIITFSRSAIIALTLATTFLVLKTSKKKALSIIFIGIFISVLVLISLYSKYLLADSSAIWERLQYIEIAKEMIFTNPLGVGIAQFTQQMQNFSEIKLLPWQIQPVHNFYLLMISETGLLGLIFLVIGLWSLINRVLRKPKGMRHFSLALLVFLLVVSIFDHYFLTSYQAQATLLISAGVILR